MDNYITLQGRIDKRYYVTESGDLTHKWWEAFKLNKLSERQRIELKTSMERKHNIKLHFIRENNLDKPMVAR